MLAYFNCKMGYAFNAAGWIKYLTQMLGYFNKPILS